MPQAAGRSQSRWLVAFGRSRRHCTVTEDCRRHSRSPTGCLIRLQDALEAFRRAAPLDLRSGLLARSSLPWRLALAEDDGAEGCEGQCGAGRAPATGIGMNDDQLNGLRVLVVEDE